MASQGELQLRSRRTGALRSYCMSGLSQQPLDDLFPVPSSMRTHCRPHPETRVAAAWCFRQISTPLSRVLSERV